MNWIKIDSHLPDKIEVIQIARMLKISPYEATGMLISFWGWMDEISENGEKIPIFFEEIDKKIGKKSFAKAMKEVGWLIENNDSISIPNFDRHNGESAKSRYLSTERKRLSRCLNKENKSNVSQNKCDIVTNKTGQIAKKSVTRKEKNRIYKENIIINDNKKEKSKTDFCAISFGSIFELMKETMPSLSDGELKTQANAYKDYYDANGWTQNGNKPIKDWKAAARGWIRRSLRFKQPAIAKRQDLNNPSDYDLTAYHQRQLQQSHLIDLVEDENGEIPINL